MTESNIDIIDYIIKDGRFHYKGHGANLGVWDTLGKEEMGNCDWIEMTKPNCGKDYGYFRITAFTPNEFGTEFHIEMYIPSWCDWDTIFNGYIDNVEFLKELFKSFGL